MTIVTMTKWFSWKKIFLIIYRGSSSWSPWSPWSPEMAKNERSQEFHMKCPSVPRNPPGDHMKNKATIVTIKDFPMNGLRRTIMRERWWVKDKIREVNFERIAQNDDARMVHNGVAQRNLVPKSVNKCPQKGFSYKKSGKFWRTPKK